MQIPISISKLASRWTTEIQKSTLITTNNSKIVTDTSRDSVQSEKMWKSFNLKNLAKFYSWVWN